jgi:hypothetical protein
MKEVILHSHWYMEHTPRTDLKTQMVLRMSLEGHKSSQKN